MADNLPLIPKKGALCADVRSVLREVFREEDYLPPLSTEKSTKPVVENEDTLPRQGEWIDKYSVECKEIETREYKLKQEHARRISREPLPNIYKLSSPVSESDVSSWRKQHGIISRKDLIPSIEQNAGRDESLWVKNILNRSSCDVSCIEIQGSQLRLPIHFPPPDEGTVQSLSMGEVVVRPPPPPAPVPQPPPPPEYIVCVPPHLDFVNFTVGNMHTQSIRLINVSKFEIRLSLRPPSRRELDVVLCGPRGLAVSSGAAAELRVRFKPRDVRAVRDALQVRVSVGKDVTVPIKCYMEPPVVNLLVPHVSWSSLRQGSGVSVRNGGDVLELGARLLGDVHYARLLLHCEAQHASFFMMTEDAWISLCLDTLTREGGVVAGPFTISPTWWRGGGAVRGGAWCRATYAGLHTAALRVLASTAVARPLHLLADALHFTPKHLTLEAHDKDYDICSEDDPACEYYVHLGIAFPNRSLSATIQLVNHSPLTYSYYWSVRPWGVCSCWQEELASGSSIDSEDVSDRLCVGALDARAHQEMKQESIGDAASAARLTRVEPACGRVAPRSSRALRVRAPDAGARLGTRRAVLMLILKDIPKESFPPNYDPMIVKTETVLAETIPGQEPWSREVCEVVCLQLEVWWEVVPVRFVLDPPFLLLPHSRRVKQVELTLQATLMYGSEGVASRWSVPPRAAVPPPLRLCPVQAAHAQLVVPLPSLPNEYPETDVFALEAVSGEWESKTTVIRQCETRHPRLNPARSWLGVVPPGAHMHTHLQVFNDTHQHICWWGTAWRWHGENTPSAACGGREPCAACRERACSCALLRPARGALPHARDTRLVYDVNAPDSDGCVATLIQVRRTLGDVARVPGGAGVDARASLVAYRVLAPRLHARALPCHGDKVPGECDGCSLDTGERKGKGTVVLRPSRALTLGRCSCYRLRITNITPLPTTVMWEPPIEKEETIKVTFLPNDFDIGSYGQVEIRVVIEARKVCGRRIFAYRARVARAYKPFYLLIDTAVAGLEISLEIPIGGEEQTSASVIMRRTQREEFPWVEKDDRPLSAEEMFVTDDKKKQVLAENICHCRFKMKYVPEVKPQRPPPANEDDLPPVEIVWEPPPLTRVCPCDECAKPILPVLEEPFCLQFKRIPLNTVRSRTLIIRNESDLSARWSAAVRNWPRKRTRTLSTDTWSSDIRDPGVAVEIAPAQGVLGARAALSLTVSVYADCWGFYKDQILIKIDKLEPIVVDVWVEAASVPLRLVRAPRGAGAHPAPTLWMSSSDPDRVIRAKNVSRSELIVHAYVLKEHEHSQDVLPFRLYLRFFDVLPRLCPCVTAFDSDHCLGEQSIDSGSEVPEDMDTGVEIFYADDCGAQNDTFFKVDPAVFTIEPGAFTELQVTLSPPEHGELAPDAVVLLRTIPSNMAGPGWYRNEPPPQLIRLRQTEREGILRASDKQLRVKFCALDLPKGDVMRIRKSFRIQNIGNGPLHLTASTEGLWTIVLDEKHHSPNKNTCGTGCGCLERDGDRVKKTPLLLPPRSSTEMTVEVCIHTEQEWPAIDEDAPCVPPKYEEFQRTTTPLSFYDDDNVLLMIPLILELEFPLLRLEPACIDFGFVTDGNSRKSFFTVAHSSRNETLDLVAEWVGNSDFVLSPRRLRLPPCVSERIYVQYTARWRGGLAEGCVRVCVASLGAGAWCRATAACRAAPARDHKCRETVHDHTDDATLLPPGFTFI